MRVLLLSHRLAPHGRGGVEVWTERLAAALERRGHEVAVAARDDREGPGPPPFSIAEEHRSYGPVFWVRHRHRDERRAEHAWRDRRMQRALGWILSAARPALVHLAHPDGWGAATVHTARDRGLATAVTLHDYKWLCARGQLVRPDGGICQQIEPAACGRCVAGQLRRRPSTAALTDTPALAGLARRLDGALPAAPRLWGRRQSAMARALAAADHIDAPSRFVARFHQRHLARPVAVIRHGIDAPSLPPPGQRPLRLGFFGAGAATKNLGLLREALRGLPPGSVELHVHGPPCGQPTAGEINHGPYAAGDVWNRMGGVDAVAIPSRWPENAPLVAVEARAAGRPLLVSAHGGLPELVDDGVDGRVLPDSPEAWAIALAELAASPGRCRDWAGSPPPSADAMAAAYEAAYRSALQRRSAPSSSPSADAL